MTTISAAFITVGILTGAAFAWQSSVTASATADDATATTARSEAVLANVAKARVDTNAETALSTAKAIADEAATKVDTAPLVASIASLADYSHLDPDTVGDLTAQTQTQAAAIKAAADEADRVAADAAAAAAAEAAAQAAAEALAEGNTVSGAKATAERLASSEYGWDSSQFSCLVSLWSKESGWSYEAYNASSGATGIPQALPGSKMASVADDWQTNATTQILWGLKYIKSSYGTPCSAWSHSQSVNWY